MSQEPLYFLPAPLLPTTASQHSRPPQGMAMSHGLHTLPAWMLLLLVTLAAGHTLAVAKTPLVAEHAGSRLLLQRKTASGGGGSAGLITKPLEAVGNPFLTVSSHDTEGGWKPWPA